MGNQITTQQEWDARGQRHGFPWCDTCKHSAVYREGQGYLHSTPDCPSGVFRHNDPSDHEVTVKEWWGDF